MDIGVIIKLLMWIIVILIVAYLVKTFVLDPGVTVVDPGEVLIPG